MTLEQKKKVRETGLKLKEILFDFTGSITYHFSANKRDVKIEIKEADVAKQT